MQIFILNSDEKVVGTLTSNTGSNLASPFFEDEYSMDLYTGAETFTFKTFSNIPQANNIVVGNYVAFQYKDDTKLFQITSVMDEHNTEFVKTVYCEMAGIELINSPVRPKEFPSVSLKQFVTSVLSDTEWKVGSIDSRITEVYTIALTDYTTVYGALQEYVVNTFGGEISFRVVMKNGKVVAKYVDVFAERGTFDGFRFSYHKNVDNVVRTVDSSELATALIGVGSNNIDFKEVTATDKPKNQDWIGDEESYKQWNRNGSHIFGISKHDTDDPATLLSLTRKDLEARKNPKISYELGVGYFDYGELDVGDTVYCVDNDFTPPLHLSARVNQLVVSFTDKDKNACVLANFKEVQSKITDELRQLASLIDEKFPIGSDQIKDGAVIGDKISQGAVNGNHVAHDTLIADHIKANQIKTEHLEADSITAEKIKADEIETDHLKANSITTEKLSANVVTAEKIEAGAINTEHLTADLIETKHLQANSVTADKIQANSIEADHIKGNTITGNHIIGSTITGNHIQGNTITGDKIIGNTITGDHIIGESITGNHIVGGTIEGVHIKGEAITGDHIHGNVITGNHIQSNTISSSHIQAGAIGSNQIQTGALTSDKMVIANGFIKNAMIDSIVASKITSGEIDTSKVTIQSPNGNIVISDSTQQFKDKNGNVRVQIGEDDNGDFTFVLLDETGQGVLIDHNGLKEKAISEGLIKNEMIGDGEINGNKVDVDSIITKINEDGTESFLASRVQLDTTGQKLDVSFSEIKNTVTANKKEVDSLISGINTELSGMETQINSVDSALADISSDSKLTPSEKANIKKDLDVIIGEKPTVITQADTYGITTDKTNYENSYNTLYNYVNPLVSNLTTTSSVNGTTMRSYFKDYYTKKATLLKTISDSAKGLISNVDSKVDNIQIGGRNLLKDSGRVITGTSYNLADYYISETLTDSEVVTIALKGALGSDRTSFGIYNSGGNVHVTTLLPSDKGTDGVFRKTFNWKTGSTNQYLRIYHMISTATSSSTIEWVKLVRGNKSTTDWSPAPEDTTEEITTLNTAISVEQGRINTLVSDTTITKNGTTTKLKDAHSSLEQTVSGIKTTVSETTTKLSEIEGLGRNLIIRSTETQGYYLNVDLVASSIDSTSDYIAVEPNKTYVFTKNTTSDAEQYFRIQWYTANKTYISRIAISDNEYVWTAPSTAYYVRVSYPKSCKPKMELGTKATDFSLAPEDIDSRISHAETSITQNATDISLRATKTEMNQAINNIQIGGRNYALESDTEKNLYGSQGAYNYYSLSDAKENMTNKTITVSWEAKKTGTVAANMYAYLRNSSSGSLKPVSATIGDATTGWKRYSVSFSAGTNPTSANQISIHATTADACVSVKNVKVEIGNKATDWCPAEEDYQTRIKNTEAQLTVQADQIASKVSTSTYNTDVNSLKTRLSTAESNITQNATNINLRVTKEDFNALQIGGDNLLENSSFHEGASGWGNESYLEFVELDGYKCAKLTSAGLNTADNKAISNYVIGQSIYSKIKDDIQGTQRYTFSLWVKTSDFQRGTVNPHTRIYMEYSANNHNYNCPANVSGLPANYEFNSIEKDKWVRMEWHFYLQSSWTGTNANFQIYLRDWSGTIYFRDAMLVRGDKLMDYTPSANDLAEKISDVEGRLSQAEIKIDEDSIISTVTQSDSLLQLLGSKADASEIDGLATLDDVKSAVADYDVTDKVNALLQNQVSDDDSILGSVYTTKSEMEQTKDDITMSFGQAGGINLIKNSLGFGGLNDGNWVCGHPNLYPGSFVTGWTNFTLGQYATVIYTINDYTTLGLKAGDTITWSVKLKTTSGTKRLAARISAYLADGTYTSYVGSTVIAIGSNGYSYVTYTLEADRPKLALMFQNVDSSTVTTSTTEQYAFPKLEFGNQRTYPEKPNLDESQYFVCGYDPDAEQLGFESSIEFSGTKTTDYTRLRQPFPTVVGNTYTVGYYYKLPVAKNFQVSVCDNALGTIASNSHSTVTDGYQYASITFKATTSTSQLRFSMVYGQQVFVTGIMVNAGSIPFAHTFSKGEVYNTNINFDMNGIKVMQLDSNGNPIGYTIMSPTEFAGYYDTDGDGSYEKIFYLNQDAVVSKKSVITDSMIMGHLKILNLTEGDYKGWAFVPSTTNDWNLSEGTE